VLVGADEGYLLANQQIQAGTRFEALATLFDRSTFGHLREIGVGSGWRCWEVGAGGMSVPLWLVTQVGPTGLVLATDIDTSWLAGLGPGPVQILRHDVGVEDPPATELDLVHARLVLTHVPRREAALTSMIAALRSGGWILVEDADPGLQPLLCPDDHGPAQHLANRLRTGFRTLMSGRDADLAYGRTLPRLLREHGLVDVAADAPGSGRDPSPPTAPRTDMPPRRRQLRGARPSASRGSACTCGPSRTGTAGSEPARHRSGRHRRPPARHRSGCGSCPRPRPGRCTATLPPDAGHR
jgi:hypothetical protein